MSQYNDFAIQLVEKLGKYNVKIDEPMRKHTSFKVGGPADILVTPESYDQLKEVISLSRINKIPCLVIGNGSNILVKDGGIRGIVLKISKLNEIKVDNDKMIVQSGAILSKVSKVAAEYEFSGFEFASGIPGSVGGAITMNAGAYNGEISQVIESALVLDKDMNVLTLSKEDLELGYRMSSIVKNGYTVLEAVFKFEKGNKDNIYARIEELSNKRREKQPLEYPSAGSTFKRPEGYFAAKLIEDSGLKGVSVGDAEVSKKHSGFIINKGSATASDIIHLINLVQNTVKDKFHVDLHTEVIIVGEDK